MRPSHLRVIHANPSFRGPPREWYNVWYRCAVGAKDSWRVLDLSEWVTQQARRRLHRCKEIRLHLGSIFVTGSSAAAVIVENLGLRMSARKTYHLQTYQVRYIIGDRARWLDKLIAYNLYRAKVDKTNPGRRLAVHRLARGGVLFPSIARSKNMYHCVNSIACKIPSHISHNAMSYPSGF